MQPVEALLEVAAYPDEEISAISFNFWHRLMHRLLLGQHSAPGQRDVEVTTSHSQDPTVNTRSAVSPPPAILCTCLPPKKTLYCMPGACCLY